MKLSGAQAAVRLLAEEGVGVLFGYPGGAILPVYDALADSGIRHVLVRHEQNAAHAASGYARATGRVGVCLATSGPGATNLITGIATAYMDSIPMVAITGQVPLAVMGRDAFQEVDIIGATASCTKHSYLVKKAPDLPRIIKEAFHIASTGRPGPVLIDLPKDVASTFFAFSPISSIHIKSYKPTYDGHPKQVERVAAALAASDRPVICAGGGVISAAADGELRQLAETAQIPVTTTLMGIGAFPMDHPLALGMVGHYGAYAANQAVANADLLLIVGARLGDRAVRALGEFGRRATVAHIDIDPAEIGKNVSTAIPVVGDARRVLADLLARVQPKTNRAWLKAVEQWRQPVQERDAGDKTVKPQYVLSVLSALTREDAIVATDVGQHQIWACNCYRTRRPRTFLSSGGMGTMGYGLPAAIGAKIGRPEQEVILITGDGSFQMNMPELATLRQEGLNIKILLFNNGTLGMVRELQMHYHQGRYYQVHMRGNPDFCLLARAYDIPAIQVTGPGEVKEALSRMLAAPGPVLVDCRIDAMENVLPPVQPVMAAAGGEAG